MLIALDPERYVVSNRTILMVTTQVKPELVALFDAPKPKEAKAESFRMPLRYACQDYLAWKKSQPRAAEALNQIFIDKAGFSLDEIMEEKDGKPVAPDTRNLTVNDPERLKSALEEAKQLKLAYKAAVEAFKAKSPALVVDEKEYTTEEEVDNLDVVVPPDSELENVEEVIAEEIVIEKEVVEPPIDPEPDEVVPEVKLKKKK